MNNMFLLFVKTRVQPIGFCAKLIWLRLDSNPSWHIFISLWTSILLLSGQIKGPTLHTQAALRSPHKLPSGGDGPCWRVTVEPHKERKHFWIDYGFIHCKTMGLYVKFYDGSRISILFINKYRFGQGPTISRGKGVCNTDGIGGNILTKLEFLCTLLYMYNCGSKNLHA